MCSRFVDGTGMGWWMFHDMIFWISLHTFEDWFKISTSKQFFFVPAFWTDHIVYIYICMYVYVQIYVELLNLSSLSCGLALECVCLGRQHGTSWGAVHHWNDGTWDGCWMMLAWSRTIRSNTMMIWYVMLFLQVVEIFQIIIDHSCVGKLYWRGAWTTA